MNQAGGLLALGLRCYVSAEQATEITAHCMESVAADLRDLIALYGEKAKFLLQEYAIGDLFEGWDDKEALGALKALRNFYLTRYSVCKQVFLGYASSQLCARGATQVSAGSVLHPGDSRHSGGEFRYMLSTCLMLLSLISPAASCGQQAYKTPTLEGLPSTPVQLPDLRNPSTTPQSDKRP